MKTLRSILGTVAALAAFGATPAAAQQVATGVWIDHTGRGAVEIKACGDALCGHVVWIKDAKNKSACRTQILGNVRQVGTGTWDKGWIIDPDDNARYSVELKTIGADRLRGTGYMGSKLFSETMTWRRAPADLQRCDGVEAARPDQPAQTAAVPPARVVTPPAPTPPAAAPSPVVETPHAPIETMPLPQRQVTAPAPLPPIVAPAPATPAPRIAQPAPAPLPSVEPSQAEPAAPQITEEETEPKPARRERSQRQASSKRKSGGRECSLDLPYITLRYPCDAF